MNYADIRAANAHAFPAALSQELADRSLPGRPFFELDPYWPIGEDKWNQAHALAIQQVARQQEQGNVDWDGTYGARLGQQPDDTVLSAVPSSLFPVPSVVPRAVDGPTLLAAILAAVIGVLFPPSAAAEPLIQAVLTVIIRVMLDSLQTSYTSGQCGATASEFNQQVEQWAQQAAAAQ